MKTPLIAFGCTYESYSALARAFGIDRQLLYTRIKTYNWSVEKAVLTDKHGSIRKSYTDHSLLLKSPILFNLSNRIREAIERLKHLKQQVTKLCLKRIKLINKAFKPLNLADTHPKGHGRYSVGRFTSNPTLAESIGCIYLAKIPLSNNSFYLKVGITMHTNASNRKRSLPKRSIILESKQAELHRCFQVEQIILMELKDKNLRIPKLNRFEGYSEVLALVSNNNSVHDKYSLRLKSALKESLSYNDFIKINSI